MERQPGAVIEPNEYEDQFAQVVPKMERVAEEVKLTAQGLFADSVELVAHNNEYAGTIEGTEVKTRTRYDTGFEKDDIDYKNDPDQ